MYGLHLNNRTNQRNQQNVNNVQQGDAAGQNAVQAQPALHGNPAAGEAGGAATLGFQPYIRPSMFTVKVCYADLATEWERQLTKARANQTTGLTNGRAAN